jgi:hemolysin activation/secretion protein
MGMKIDAGRAPLLVFRAITWAICGAMSNAFAQGTGAPTDPFVQQQQRERALQERDQRRLPDVRLPSPLPAAEPPTPQGDQPCFPIQRIDVDGADVVPVNATIVRAFEGECLKAGDINGLMTLLQNDLIERGYVTTRVLASPQDLGSGQLTLTVVPGRVHRIQKDEPQAPRSSLWNTLPVDSGDLLNLRDIEQGLENFKRVPTADADIQIVPGQDDAPGESDLHIRYQQAFPLRLSVFADDGGSRSTGRYQGGATLSFDNPLTLSDLLYVSLSRDVDSRTPRGTRNVSGHYSVPFGYWMLSFNGNQYRYRQAVAGINQTYVYAGTSRSLEAKLSRVIYRDTARKTQLYARAYQRRSDNFIDDTEVEVQRRRVAGLEVGVSHREFLGSAVLDANLAFRKGTGAFHALPAPEEAFGEGESRAGIVSADLQFNTPFKIASTNWRYSGSLRAQWTDKPLTPQDRFAIGGRYTVRGFDGEISLSAERGFVWRNDLGLALGNTGQELYLGLDFGQVNGPADVYLLGRRLAGAVLGVRGSVVGVQYDLFAGLPLKKPEGFQAASVVYGFSVNYQF